MLLNAANLNGLFSGFQMTFNKGLQGADSVWSRFAMLVASTHKDETYAWLDNIPGMREWIGPRAVQNLKANSYTILNRPFEQTIGVDRDNVEDDSYGIYAPMFEQMGRNAGEMPDRLVFEALAAGFTANCYDGQYFFDTNHPVLNEQGQATEVTNMQAGSGEPWYLFDTTRPIKPLIWQERKPFGQLVRKDRPEDDNVFNNKELIYGSDGRGNAGYGLWQLAFASKATLDATNYKAARAAMLAFRGDYGKRLGVKPNLLLCGPANESAARKLLNSELASGGETNEWKGTAELIVTPWIG